MDVPYRKICVSHTNATSSGPFYIILCARGIELVSPLQDIAIIGCTDYYEHRCYYSRL